MGDHLLFRALNRGYAMSRFQWPDHFALLNNDRCFALYHRQLNDPGLSTTAELDWRSRRCQSLFPPRG
jgi:CRISPR-associated endonuclease/helicase Cas3